MCTHTYTRPNTQHFGFRGMPGFHGDLRAEYSGIEMSTGSTQAIWGVVVLKRCT